MCVFCHTPTKVIAHFSRACISECINFVSQRNNALGQSEGRWCLSRWIHKSSATLVLYLLYWQATGEFVNDFFVSRLRLILIPTRHYLHFFCIPTVATTKPCVARRETTFLAATFHMLALGFPCRTEHVTRTCGCPSAAE